MVYRLYQLQEAIFMMGKRNSIGCGERKNLKYHLFLPEGEIKGTIYELIS
jgi:hypothetical protein